jgi:hypothetical protein
MNEVQPKRCRRKLCPVGWFVPKDKRQRYCDVKCKNAAAQERLRKRAKENGNS